MQHSKKFAEIYNGSSVTLKEKSLYYNAWSDIWRDKFFKIVFILKPTYLILFKNEKQREITIYRFSFGSKTFYKPSIKSEN